MDWQRNGGIQKTVVFDVIHKLKKPILDLMSGRTRGGGGGGLKEGRYWEVRSYLSKDMETRFRIVSGKVIICMSHYSPEACSVLQ